MHAQASVKTHHMLQRRRFTLRELEDVLLPVDDAQSSIGCELTNVARVEPAILAEDLFGLSLVLEVPLEDRGATDHHLSPGRSASCTSQCLRMLESNM